MKISDRESQELVKQLDEMNQGQVNYKDFLKYSYLCEMYLKHYNLELLLTNEDKEKKGLITVAQLDKIL